MPAINSSVFRFNKQAAALDVSATDLYNALLADAEKQSSNWDLQGRQANLWKQFGRHLIWQYFLSFFLALISVQVIFHKTCLMQVVRIPNKFLEPSRYVLWQSCLWQAQWTCWNHSILSTILPFLKLLKLSETQWIHRRCAPFYSSVVESSSFWLNSTPNKYLKRAANFMNVWNPNITVPNGPNIMGMMQVRNWRQVKLISDSE